MQSVEPPLRVVLDEADFRALVSGQVVATQTATGRLVQIILSDIGWDAMDRALTDAVRNQAG